MQRRWVVSPDYRSAIKMIVSVRVESGLSQREVSRRLGKPPSFVNKIEQIERRIDIVEFLAFADALGIPPADLIRRVRDALPNSVTI